MYAVKKCMLGLPFLFKIRDASRDRNNKITASNLTKLTLTLTKSSENVLSKYSFNSFYTVL